MNRIIGIMTYLDAFIFDRGDLLDIDISSTRPLYQPRQRHPRLASEVSLAVPAMQKRSQVFDVLTALKTHVFSGAKEVGSPGAMHMIGEIGAEGVDRATPGRAALRAVPDLELRRMGWGSARGF